MHKAGQLDREGSLPKRKVSKCISLISLTKVKIWTPAEPETDGDWYCGNAYNQRCHAEKFKSSEKHSRQVESENEESKVS